MSYYFFTLLAGVGIQAVVAGDAVRVVLHLDVFASIQGLVAVLAVESVTHDVWLTSCKQRINRRSLAFTISEKTAQEEGEGD